MSQWGMGIVDPSFSPHFHRDPLWVEPGVRLDPGPDPYAQLWARDVRIINLRVGLIDSGRLTFPQDSRAE